MVLAFMSERHGDGDSSVSRIVLIVNDPADVTLIREVAADTAFADWQFDDASTVASGRARLAEPTDVILLDLGLPDAAGVETVAQVRTAAPDVPIVVLTGPDADHLGVRAVELGAQGFLRKTSLSSHELGQTLTMAIDRGRLQRRVEEMDAALRESERRYEDLYHRAPDMLVSFEMRRATVVEGNLTLASALGCEVSQLGGRNLAELFHPDCHAALGVALRDLERHRAAPDVELRLRTDGGNMLDVSGSFVTVCDRRGVVSHQAVLRNISDRKQTEARFRELESQFVEMAANISQVFWIWDADRHGVIYASPACEEVWGRSVEEIYEPTFDWLNAVHEEDRQKVVTAVASERRFTLDYRIIRPDGTVRWIHDRGFPSTGAIRRIAGITEDITERRQLEQQLHQAQKMEGIGRLAGGIAHDFNNILTAIVGYADLLLEQIDRDKPIWSDLQEIKAAGDRATALTRQLLAFGRKQVLRMTVVDVNAVVADVEAMLQRLLGEDIVIATDLASELRPIFADPTQLEQILMNLAVNARDAMPDGGLLTIGTSNADVGPERGAGRPMAPGRYAVLSVSDDGTGMDEQTQERLFEPFFTTKAKGKGSGLGLATVYGTVKQIGGFIWVDSEVGKGSTFRLYFPETRLHAEPVPQPLAGRSTDIGREAVLLVEDDDAVRRFTADVLHRFGYRVIQAENPAVALELVERDAPVIHLLLTDVIMPGMTGPKLAAHLRTGQADLPVLYMSGYSDEAVTRQGSLDGPGELLEKPFAARTLLEAVRHALDGSASARPQRTATTSASEGARE